MKQKFEQRIIVFKIIVRICSSLFKWNYLKNENLFPKVFFPLWNYYEMLNIFKRKKIFIANVIPKLQNVKDLVRPLSKECHFRTSFESQRVKGSETLLKSASDPFYDIF